MATATAPTAADSPFDQLSAGLLQQVLQGVQQRERLTQCSLVCRAWAEAAALATQDITCTPKNTGHVRVLEGWLGKNGGRARSLVLCHSYLSKPPRLQLPWKLLRQLQVLRLTRTTIPLIKRSGSRGSRIGAGSIGDGSTSTTTSTTARSTAMAPMLPQLKELELTSCTFNSARCLRQLMNSPQLTSLKMSCSQRYRSMGAGGWCDLSLEAKQQASTEFASMLQPLQQLVVLSLHWLPVSSAVFQHTASMQSLQELDVELTVSTEPSSADSTVAPLACSLTKLQVTDRPSSPTVELPPRWQQLTSLQQVDLLWCTLNPSALAGVSQLTGLRLQGCTLLPDESQGAAALLRALQPLTCLQSLRLDNVALHLAPRDSLSLFGGLTASSQLTKLELGAFFEQPLPEGALQHALPPGKQLPHLQVLELEFRCDGEDDEQFGWCVDGDDIASIAGSCPALQRLQLDGVVREGADVSALQLLPDSCGSLVIGGDGFDDEAAAAIAQLSHLTFLCWSNSPELTDLGLESLTSMHALDKLYMYDCTGISREVCEAAAGDEDVGFYLELEGDVYEGPVWQQLEEICEHSTMCLRMRLQRQEMQNVAQQAQIARLQRQLDDRNAQLADRGEQLAARDARLAERDAEVQQLKQQVADRDRQEQLQQPGFAVDLVGVCFALFAVVVCWFWWR